MSIKRSYGCPSPRYPFGQSLSPGAAVQERGRLQRQELQARECLLVPGGRRGRRRGRVSGWAPRPPSRRIPGPPGPLHPGLAAPGAQPRLPRALPLTATCVGLSLGTTVMSESESESCPSSMSPASSAIFPRRAGSGERFRRAEGRPDGRAPAPPCGRPRGASAGLR